MKGEVKPSEITIITPKEEEKQLMRKLEGEGYRVLKRIEYDDKVQLLIQRHRRRLFRSNVLLLSIIFSLIVLGILVYSYTAQGRLLEENERLKNLNSNLKMENTRLKSNVSLLIDKTLRLEDQLNNLTMKTDELISEINILKEKIPSTHRYSEALKNILPEIEKTLRWIDMNCSAYIDKQIDESMLKTSLTNLEKDLEADIIMIAALHPTNETKNLHVHLMNSVTNPGIGIKIIFEGLKTGSQDLVISGSDIVHYAYAQELKTAKELLSLLIQG